MPLLRRRPTLEVRVAAVVDVGTFSATGTGRVRTPA